MSIKIVRNNKFKSNGKKFKKKCSMLVITKKSKKKTKKKV